MQSKVIIVGQGLCGTWLSFYLEQAGIPYLVIDDGQPNSSTRVASGLVNPVTGRRMVHTWMADTIIPFAVKAYADMEACLGFTNSEPLLRRCDILDFFTSPDRLADFEHKAKQLSEFLSWPADEQAFARHVRYDLGFGIVSPAYQISLPLLVEKWRQHLQHRGCLLAENFDAAALQLKNGGVQYKGIEASHLLFANGAAAASSGYFQLLPFALNKGEALILSIPHLPHHVVYKKGFSITPWRDGLFWAGSTYQREFENALPSAAFRHQMESWLQQFLRHPYTVEDHVAAIRPTTLERRPFAGWHPTFAQLGMLNGMGTKGVTLAPYFARQLVDNITLQTAIMPEADVARFANVLQRS